MKWNYAYKPIRNCVYVFNFVNGDGEIRVYTFRYVSKFPDGYGFVIYEGERTAADLKTADDGNSAVLSPARFNFLFTHDRAKKVYSLKAPKKWTSEKFSAPEDGEYSERIRFLHELKKVSSDLAERIFAETGIDPFAFAEEYGDKPNGKEFLSAANEISAVIALYRMERGARYANA